MILFKLISTLLFDPKKLLVFLLLGVGGFGLFQLISKGQYLEENTKGLSSQTSMTLSFGDQSKTPITNVRLASGETKSFYIWANTASTVPLTNLGITVLYDPRVIKSLDVEQTEQNKSSLIVLAKERSSVTYQDEVYQAITLSLGSLCYTDYCSSLDISKAPVAKINLVAQNGDIQESSLFIHPNSVVMKRGSTNNLFITSAENKLVINPQFSQSNVLTVRAKVAGTNPTKATLELQSRARNGTYSTVHTFEVTSTEFEDYFYTGESLLTPNNIRLRFIDDEGITKDAVVDYIKIGNDTYQTEDTTTYSTGTWQNNTLRCSGGFLKTQTLHCNGYFDFLKSL